MYGFVRVLAAEKHAQLVTEVVTEVQVEVVAQLAVAICRIIHVMTRSTAVTDPP